LELELLGRTVQCGRCRNYFVVTPASRDGWQGEFGPETGRPHSMRVEAAIHFLRRAWIEDGQGNFWYVRYPTWWAVGIYWGIGGILLAGCAWLALVTTMFAWGLFMARQGAALVPMLIGAVLLGSLLGLVAWYLRWGTAVLTTVVHSKKALPAYIADGPRWRASVVIGPAKWWDWVLGRWQIRDNRGEVLAECRRVFWLWRLFSRKRWIMRVMSWEGEFVIEETLWMPGLLRWLLLLPLGLLRLVFIFTPWLLQPFRRNYRVRVAESSYVVAQTRTQVSLMDTTVVELYAGAEQLLEERLRVALAALLHGKA